MYKIKPVGIGWAVFKAANGFWQQISKEYLQYGNAMRKLKEVQDGNKGM